MEVPLKTNRPTNSEKYSRKAVRDAHSVCRYDRFKPLEYLVEEGETEHYKIELHKTAGK